MSVDVDMSEVALLNAQLAAAGRKADRLAAKALRSATSRLRADVERDTPVLTGETKASVRSNVSRGTGSVTVGGAGFWLEFGTVDTRPQPFVYRNIPESVRQLTDALATLDPLS